jgi:serine/threonine protein kinase
VTGEIICSKCNAINPPGTSFCSKCGTPIKQEPQDKNKDSLVGAFVGERFLVKRILGEGGMGVVYEAEQTAMDRKVALKVLHPHLTDEDLYVRFRKEATASSKLDHPNTITVYDFGKTDKGSLYLAMEYIQGISLDDEIASKGPLDWQRTCKIGSQICGSLRNAHNNGIIHRDMKPENVMLCEKGDEKDFVKVLDFGIAKTLDDDGTDQRKALTKTGMVFGTPQYMSPEQIRGEKIDARSDIYSVGVILYQMLTGTLPFKADTPMGLLTKHLMDKPPAFSTINPQNKVPEALETLVMKTLEKEADKRPQTMKELGAALDELAGVPNSAGTTASGPAASANISSGATIPMPAQNSSSTGGSSKKGGMAGIVIVLIILLAAGGGAAWYFVMGPGAVKKTKRVATAAAAAGVAKTAAAVPVVPPPAATAAQMATAQPAPAPAGPGTLSVIPTVENNKKSGKKSSGGSAGHVKKKPSSGSGKNNGGGKNNKNSPGATKPPVNSNDLNNLKIPDNIKNKIPSDISTAKKDIPCSISSGGTPESGQVAAAVRRRQRAIKLCVQDGKKSVSIISYEVKAGAKPLNGLRRKASSNNSQAECIIKILKTAKLPKPAQANTQGTIRFDMERTGGELKKCKITVK